MHSTSTMTAASPTVGYPMPNPNVELAHIVREWLLAQGHPDAKYRLMIELADAREQIAMLTLLPGKAAMLPPRRTEETPLGAKQKRILAALLDGPLKGDALAAKIGLANRSSLYSSQHMTGLVSRGLVVSGESGYELTDKGEDVANCVMEG